MNGRLVAITGASCGIGLALARAFAAEGHPLLLVSRHLEPFADMPEGRVIYARADVADYVAMEQAIQGAEARFDSVECLINNAGFANARDFCGVEPESFAEEIDANLKGVLNCTPGVLPGMSSRGRAPSSTSAP